MSKKIDLNKKHVNQSIAKNTHPVKSQYNLPNYNQGELEKENDMLNNQVNQNSMSHNTKSKPRLGLNPMNFVNKTNSMSSEEKIEFIKNNPAVKKAILKVAIIVIPILLLILLIAVLIAAIVERSNSNLAMGGYYAMKCPEVTVIFTDKQNGYQETGTNTYPLEEYVAGVVAGEVGFLGSIELDKAFAIAARSYFLTHETDCTIESSDRKQVFRELVPSSSTDQLAREAAEETQGKVLLLDGKVYSSQYDAFACIAQDANYYTISQQNQKIPKNWIEARVSRSDWYICNGKENLVNHHGNGMSAYGGLYLAQESGYAYDEILSFYFEDLGVSISSGAFVSSIAGLEVKDTTGSEVLTGVALSEYLNSQGTSIDELNNFIYQSVTEVGKGTRAGVVVSAVSLINFLYDNFNVRLPYYWAGQYQTYGVNPNFGKLSGASCSSNACYYYSGYDCSGFVSWAIKNGGYNIGRNTTVGFHNSFSKNSCNIKDSSCIGQPGDLINSRNLHVIMIVAVDQESGKYMIAESTGGYGLIMREWAMHQDMWGNETRILLMDDFYNNPNNIDSNY